MSSVAGRTPNLIYTHSFESPVGLLHVAVDKLGKVLYVGYGPPGRRAAAWDMRENKYACGELEYQLEEYFGGSRQSFTLELRLEGTSFQKAVWSRLLKTDFGELVTYSHLAQKIGRRDAARAVGNAVAANPIVLLIPCHRVIPVSGGLGSYARRSVDSGRGVEMKRHLLALEGAMLPSSLRTSA